MDLIRGLMELSSSDAPVLLLALPIPRSERTFGRLTSGFVKQKIINKSED